MLLIQNRYILKFILTLSILVLIYIGDSPNENFLDIFTLFIELRITILRLSNTNAK